MVRLSIRRKYKKLPKGESEFVPRSFGDVLLVCASMIPESYDRTSDRIFTRSFYKSPEVVATSWQELSDMIFDYLYKEKGYKDLELDYLANDDRLLLEVLSDQVDYSKYLLVEKPVRFRRRTFKHLISNNRKLLQEKQIIKT